MNTSDLVVECLINEGVTKIFGYPGIGNQRFLDSIYKYSEMEFILVRHEQVAALVADIHGRITKFPSVCTSTYGGGATNMVNGIAQAYMEGSPVVAIVGERKAEKDRRNIDQVAVFRPITKMAVSIEDPAQVAETIKTAFQVASTEPVGPVYVGLPTDVATMQVNSVEKDIQREPAPANPSWAGALDPEDVMRVISDLMPSNAVVTVDVGDIMIYVHRFLEEKEREFIRPGRFYSMGIGLTGALAAKIARPDSEVYCITGDGGLSMVVQDLETAVRENLKIIVIVFNNSCLSMIRRRQINDYEKHIIGVDLCDNDFAKVAQGFCAAGEHITSIDGLKAGLENAQRSELPYVLDVVVRCDESLR